MSALLELRGVHVSYGSIKALHGIDLEIQSGQIATLIGANGAGKSTTLRTISGLLRPSAGEIYFEGKPIHTLAPHEIVKNGIVHVPEGRGIFANLSVAENLQIGGYARRRGENLKVEEEKTLQLFPRLRERMSQNAGTLSGGEQQMLALARSLMAKPRLLLLDEPSLGMAPQVVHTIFATIREINQTGTTILLVEQNAHMALQIAHEAYVYEVGRVAMKGPAKELEKSPQVRKAYLGI